MNVDGRPFQTIWPDQEDEGTIHSIDQRALPFELKVEQLRSLRDVKVAIRDMHLRGAPLIGVAAAFGLYLAARECKGGEDLQFKLKEAANQLGSTRPTAINLGFALQRQLSLIEGLKTENDILQTLRKGAIHLLEEEKENCRRIGRYGLDLIKEICREKGSNEINILTHCNAGWLACIDYGTATAPIYQAHDAGIEVHVWVDETRPRNQGSKLTAWELGQHGVRHTIIADNTGGHLMQHNMVDLVLVGSDRTTRNGDVANKIGTYLKALAAADNKVPFYVALPSSSIDWSIQDGISEIPIEERDTDEVKLMEGMSKGELLSVRISPMDSPAANYGFDVTPARLVKGLITEKGICPATAEGIASLFNQAL